jgi:phage protein D
MTPIFDIRIGERSIASQMRSFLISLSLSDKSGLESDGLAIQLANKGLELPRTGTQLQVGLGYKETGLIDMGLFEIDGYTISQSSVSIRAHAVKFAGPILTPKTRTFRNMKMADIIKQIAKENALDIKVSEDVPDLTYDCLHQTNESDLTLLSRIKRQFNLFVKPTNKSLIATPKGEGVVASPSVTLRDLMSETGRLGYDTALRDVQQEGTETSKSGRVPQVPMPTITLKPQWLLNWSVSHSSRANTTAVTAKWYDQANQVMRYVTVGNDKAEGRGTVLNGFLANEAEARAAANAAYCDSNLSSFSFSATMPGAPMASSESRLVLEGFQHGLPTEWVVSQVTHTLSGNGFQTSIIALLPAAFQKQLEEHAGLTHEEVVAT